MALVSCRWSKPTGAACQPAVGTFWLAQRRRRLLLSYVAKRMPIGTAMFRAEDLTPASSVCRLTPRLFQMPRFASFGCTTLSIGPERGLTTGSVEEHRGELGTDSARVAALEHVVVLELAGCRSLSSTGTSRPAALRRSIVAAIIALSRVIEAIEDPGPTLAATPGTSTSASPAGQRLSSTTSAISNNRTRSSGVA